MDAIMHASAGHPATQPAQGTPAPLRANSPLVLNIRRRLERWELPHLRELAARQAEQIEQLQAELEDTQRRLNWAEDCAEQWHEQTMQALNDAVDADPKRLCIGLTQDGRVAVLVNTAPTPHEFGTHLAMAA
jgi:hypothetical protein